MTTIVAVTDGVLTAMAADSASNIYDRPVYTARKIRRLTVGTADRGGGEDALIGFAGDGGGPGAVTANLSVSHTPDWADQDDVDSWATALAHAITEIYVDHGLTDHGRLDGSVILAIRGRLWCISHNQALRETRPALALGSGEGPAMGAALTLLRAGRHTIDEVARIAAETGVELDRHSGLPVVTEFLDHPNVPTPR